MRPIMRAITAALLLALPAVVAAAADPSPPSEPRTVIERVFFDRGQATVKPEFDASLMRLAGDIRAEGHPRVEVRGHTDSAEAPGEERRLAKRRIEAVVERLRTLGVALRHVTQAPEGATDPWGDNRSAKGRALNRRVDVVRYLSTPAVPPAAPAGSPRPVMEIPVTDYRFDPVVEGGPVEHGFTVRNTGDAELRINNVRTG